MSDQPPCLFLSHAGSDTEAARELKQRILASPTAREAGLRVWFDKDDLEAGTGWQEQLERALTEQATAFAVYVGSRGVINWVDREVRVGLSRATGAKAIPFIPILGGRAIEPSALPPFAQQFQGVRDPLGNENELARLIKAALSGAETKSVVLTTDPFVGLRAMTEAEADRFFGRDDEINDVVGKLRTHRLLAIVAESGSGKSSLVRAGVVPAFRGGALEDLSRQRPDDRTWHVVVMRPGANPLEGLRRAVTETAERLGLSGEATAGLRRRIAFSDPGESAYALRCDLPVAATQTLLVVDQFEELLTQTPEADRAPFIDFLLALADRPEDGIRVVLTMRADYFNLTRAHDAFFARLQQDNQTAVYRLKGISPAGLDQAIRKPLKMAGHEDAEQQKVLLDLFRRDMRDRPGDLALIQMALFVIWRRRKEYGGNLVNAYVAVNGISGALADEADRVMRETLSEPQRQALLPIFVRLTRLGETGGVTRRIAPLDEFVGETRKLVEDLARDDHGRLLLVGSDTAEIAHEALITQWGWLQNQINQHAAPIRQLAGVMEDAAGWALAGEADRPSQLANAGDATRYDTLKRAHPDWLTAPEARFVDDSNAAIEKRRKRDLNVRRRALLAAAAMSILFFLALGASLFAFWKAGEANTNAKNARSAVKLAREATEAERNARLEALQRRMEADDAAKQAKANESRALAALARVASDGGNQADALKLALAAWPRKEEGDDRPQLQSTLQALSRALGIQQGLAPRMEQVQVAGAVFNSDETKVLSWSHILRLWDARSGRQIGADMSHTRIVMGALLYDNDRRILSWGRDSTVRVWDAATSQETVPTMRHDADVWGAVLIDGGRRILSWSKDGTLRQWDVGTGQGFGAIMRHEGEVAGALLTADHQRIVSWSYDRTVRVWNAANGQLVGAEMKHGTEIKGIALTQDGMRIVSWSDDVRLWERETGQQIAATMAHKASVQGVVLSGDGRYILSWARDDTLRRWDAATAAPIEPIMHHGAAPLESAGHGIGGATFSADGRRILSWSWQDNSVRLWEAATGQPIGLPMKNEKRPLGAILIDDQRVLTWLDGGTMRLFDASSGERFGSEMPHGKTVTGVVLTRDRNRIISRSSNKVSLWDASGRPVASLEHRKEFVRGTVLSRDERRLLSWALDDIRVWDVATGWPVGRSASHYLKGEFPLFTSDKRRVLTAARSSLMLWDTADRRQIGRPMKHVLVRDDGVELTPDLDGAALTPNGERALSWSGNSLRTWNAVTGEQIGSMTHPGQITGAAFVGDQRILAWSADGTVQIWNAVTSAPIGQPVKHNFQVNGAVASADGRWGLSWSYSELAARLWNAETGEDLVPPLKHDRSVIGAVLTRDRRILTMTSEGVLRLWDAATGRETGTIMRHNKPPVAVPQRFGFILTADQRRVLSWGGDRTVRLWDASDGRQLGAEMVHGDAVWGAAFSREESRILSWSGDGTVRWWKAGTGEPIGAIMKHDGPVMSAALTRDERRVLSRTRTNFFTGSAWLWDVSTALPIGFAMPAADAVLMHDERTIAAWSDGVLRWHDIGWPSGDLLEIACALLPDRDTTDLKARYGVDVTEPICVQRPAAPDWSRIERAPAQ